TVTGVQTCALRSVREGPHHEGAPRRRRQPFEGSGDARDLPSPALREDQGIRARGISAEGAVGGQDVRSAALRAAFLRHRCRRRHAVRAACGCGDAAVKSSDTKPPVGVEVLRRWAEWDGRALSRYHATVKVAYLQTLKAPAR